MAVEGGSRHEDKLRVRMLPQGLLPGPDKIVDHQKPCGDDVAPIGLITDRRQRYGCSRQRCLLVDVPRILSWAASEASQGPFCRAPRRFLRFLSGLPTLIAADIRARKFSATWGKRRYGDAMPFPHAVGEIRRNSPRGYSICLTASGAEQRSIPASRGSSLFAPRETKAAYVFARYPPTRRFAGSGTMVPTRSMRRSSAADRAHSIAFSQPIRLDPSRISWPTDRAWSSASRA